MGGHIMQTYKHYLALIASLMTAFAPAAYAGETTIAIGNIAGKVLVNRGQAFAPASAGMNLKSGDKILVGSGAAATLIYGKCQVSLAAAAVFTVPAHAICADGGAAALVNGQLITPVSATVPVGRLSQMIENYSKLQQASSQQGNVETSNCLSDKIGKMKALRNFWSRNPGVDPTTMINDLDSAASSCRDMRPLQKTNLVVETPAPPPIVVDEPAPVVPGTGGGFGGTGLALAGAAGLGVAGLAAVLVLSKNSSSAAASAPAN
jgi:hypothetical protein